MVRGVQLVPVVSFDDDGRPSLLAPLFEEPDAHLTRLGVVNASAGNGNLKIFEVVRPLAARFADRMQFLGNLVLELHTWRGAWLGKAELC